MAKTKEDWKCPECSSSDVHHRVTASNPFRCGRCGSEWGGVVDKSENAGCLAGVFTLIGKAIQWCIRNPKQAGIIFLVVVTIAQISVITDPGQEGVSVGQLIFAWLWTIATIIAVAIWGTLKIKNRGGQGIDNKVTEDDIHCPSCGQENPAKARFCGSCQHSLD